MVGENRSMQINRSGTDAFAPVNRTLPDGSTQGVGFFNALDDLIKGVNNSDRNLMHGGVGELDHLLEGLTFAQANVGSGLKSIDQQNSVIEDTVLNLTTTLSSVEDLDYTAAITKMNQQMMSLEAAQSSFAKISQLSLFNFIK
jgi:flagellar hook-associated protein 3 FlgL